MRHLTILAASAALAAAALLAPPPAHAADALKVCLEEGSPPYSFKFGPRSGGFDLGVAEALAKRLGRPLEVLWYEAEGLPEKGEDTNSGIRALLSDGRCSLVGGFALYEDALKASRPYTSLPDYKGIHRADRSRRIDLAQLAASSPYLYAPMVVAVGPKAAGRKIARLADLEGLKLGAEQASLADIILLTYDGGRLRDAVTHMAPGKSLLERMDAGEYDAALVDLHRFEGYRARHPETKLQLSGFEHRIGFNMGYASTADDSELLAQVDKALAAMRDDGEFAGIAEAAGITYTAPRAPEVRPSLSLADLAGD